MRTTHTPFKTPTRSIGRDAAITVALLLAIGKPKITTLQKIPRSRKSNDFLTYEQRKN
jgi:hypothetical protein